MSQAEADVLIVEDDEGLAELLVDELDGEGYGVRLVGTVSEAQEEIRNRQPDLILTDLRLPGEDGTALLEWVRELPEPPALILITAFGTVRQAVESLKAGADDFLTKPLDLDHLKVTLERALETRRLRAEVRRFREALQEGGFHGMLGRSPQFQELAESVKRVARGSGAVLITGESGVGKELVARAVHAESPRSEAPFLAVNCAGIPEHLLESEFFGHEKGAFTGATSSRDGLFVQADGGTLLLDEIGEMSLDLQAKLLRVLEEGRVRPVGGNREHRVDVRILAATNRDLEEALEEKRFRKDLFYRLQTFQLHVPRLRDREGDLELLVGHFVSRVAARQGRRVPRLSRGVLERLQDYPFPGNVRELENVLERAVTFCEGDVVTLDHLPERVRLRAEPEPVGESGHPGAAERTGAATAAPVLFPADGEILPLRDMEARYIHWVLDRVGGNKRRAASLLGIGRRTLYRRLEEALSAEGEGENE